MRRLIALAALLLLTLPALADTHGEIRKYFKDWLTACRPDGYCSATAYVNPGANGNVADYILRLGRQAQQTYWEISFTAVAAEATPQTDFTFTIDGKPEAFTQPKSVAAYGAVNDFYFLGDGAQRLMDRLGKGGAANIGFTDSKGGAQAANFSLNGLTAAMVWIDEQQHRLGSEPVAEAPPYGLQPAIATAAPAASPIPSALLARLANDPECTLPAGPPPAAGVTIATLDADQRLYILPCAEAPENKGSKLFIERAGAFTELSFAVYDGTGSWSGNDRLNGVAFDADGKILTSFDKFNVAGDCGSRGVWIWNKDRFRLSQLRYKPDCDGVAGDFPIVFTAPPLPQVPPS